MTRKANCGDRIEGVYYAAVSSACVDEMAAFDSFPRAIRDALNEHILSIACAEFAVQVERFSEQEILTALADHWRQVQVLTRQ